MTVLFDTNVLIDSAVASRSHHGAAVRLIAAAERDTVDGLVAPTSIATCWYVAYEREDTDPRPLFELLADIMRIAPMGRSALRTALQNPGTEDFEDGHLAAAGEAAGASVVATRNESDFTSTALTPYHPPDLVGIIYT
ncbi:type II toxin-antitoxin system VapC family toxin [Salinibacter ruber]|uniref:type II toxin-antitoxin system VapC family toxin n=1 Tax=Salinibacter ruber TaxID=146919 RepID=UPI002168C8B6|nr:PIN domain-containing protein [Salinibacter ruber]MCS4201538.1 putative nucleic acid-binding protein [Salinibacter ruber]